MDKLYLFNILLISVKLLHCFKTSFSILLNMSLIFGTTLSKYFSILLICSFLFLLKYIKLFFKKSILFILTDSILSITVQFSILVLFINGLFKLISLILI